MLRLRGAARLAIAFRNNRTGNDAKGAVFGRPLLRNCVEDRDAYLV
jgi:hypothetical protein